MEAVIREGNLRLHTSEASCDVILSCQGHRLMAHKIILSIASPLLRDLLVHDLNEPSVLIFPDINSNTMSLILDYIYTGSVIVYSNTIKDFISAALLLNIHVDVDVMGKYNCSSQTEYKPFKKKEEKLIEEPDGVYSKRNQRKLPSLMPISNIISKDLKESRRMCCVIPSPWCPRVMPVLSDPRTAYAPGMECLNIHSRDKIEENDPNNNFQHSPPFTRTLSPDSDDASSSPVELDLTTSFNRIIYEQKLLSHRNDRLLFIKEPEATKDCKSESSVTNTRTPAFKKEVGERTTCEDPDKQKPFKCEDCGKCFSQLRNYKYHRSVHEGTKEFAAECSECGKVFNDRGYLSSHMKIHRDRKEYACPHCPKRFNQRVAYNMHLRIHTGVKPHECPICGKSFSRKMLLKQHQRVHTGERPYSCPECGKTFADRSNMSLHARLHTGVKPYACSLCPKSFTKKHHLKTHMNFHTGLKPYTCQKCGLAFSQSSNMRTHYKKCVLKNSGNNDNADPDSNSSA